MSKKLSFLQAVSYLNASFNCQSTGNSGTVTLKNELQQDRLILQSEDAGERVSLFVPFLTRPQNPAIQKNLNLHLLHMNADLDTLGSLRITLNCDTNYYSLCDGGLEADNEDDFSQYLQAVLNAGHYLNQEITETIAQAQLDDDGVDFNDIESTHFLKI